MMKNAKTYLARIQAAATERELTGIEITFKQDMSINCDDLGRLCRAAEDKRYTLRNNAETLRLKASFSSGRRPRWTPTTT